MELFFVEKLLLYGQNWKNLKSCKILAVLKCFGRDTEDLQFDILVLSHTQSKKETYYFI